MLYIDTCVLVARGRACALAMPCTWRSPAAVAPPFAAWTRRLWRQPNSWDWTLSCLGQGKDPGAVERRAAGLRRSSLQSGHGAGDFHHVVKRDAGVFLQFEPEQIGEG